MWVSLHTVARLVFRNDSVHPVTSCFRTLPGIGPVGAELSFTRSPSGGTGVLPTRIEMEFFLAHGCLPPWRALTAGLTAQPSWPSPAPNPELRAVGYVTSLLQA